MIGTFFERYMSGPKQRSFGNMLAHARVCLPMQAYLPQERSFGNMLAMGKKFHRLLVRERLELEKLYLFQFGAKIVHRLGQVNGALNYGKHTF
jgi:hypothetical protein